MKKEHLIEIAVFLIKTDCSFFTIINIRYTDIRCHQILCREYRCYITNDLYSLMYFKYYSLKTNTWNNSADKLSKHHAV